MRKYFIALVLLWVIACGTHKPPDPPPPPPPEVCGDLSCGPGEKETCPRDCETPPPPICDLDGRCEKGRGETPENCTDCPKPDPEPEPKCNPDKYIFDDCPEITRDFSSNRSLGNYTGAYGQPDFNWSRYFQLFKKSLNTNKKEGFNWSVHFLIDRWMNKDFYHREFKNGKYDLKKWNQQWLTHFDNSVKAAEYYGIGLHLCVFTDYGHPRWDRYKGIGKTHPWRQNTEGANVVDGEPSDLYTNWNRRLPLSSSNNKLFTWKADSEKDIQYYKGTNAAGRDFLDFVPEIAKRTYEVWKRGKLRITIRAANEPTAVVEQDGKTFIRSKGKILDDRTENYVFEVFKRAGFKSGERFRMIHEGEVYTGSVIGPKAMYWPLKTMRQYIEPRDLLFEWHGVCDLVEKDDRGNVIGGLEFFTKLHGWKTKYFNGSSDGCREGDPYIRAMRRIAATDPENFDYKLSAIYGEGGWRDWDLNWDVQQFVPPMEAGVWP